MVHWYLNKKVCPLPAGRWPLAVKIVLICLWTFLTANLGLAIEEKKFDCKIDFVNKYLNLNLDLKDKGSIDIKGNIDDKGEYNIGVFLRHFRFGTNDILTDFNTRGTIEYFSDGKVKALKGKASTQRTLLNLKPVKELQFDYVLCDDKLRVNSLSWADIRVSGGIQFKPGYFVDLALVIDNMELQSLARILGMKQSDLEDLGIEGAVSGSLKIKGPLQALKIEGKFMAYDGRISETEFRSARINVEGNWPVLRFVNSQINDTGGIVYDLKGEFNLKELSDLASPEHRVMVYSANNMMRFQDWVIKRSPDEKGQDMVEAEYSLKKNQALKMRIKNQEEMLAWERTVKF